MASAPPSSTPTRSDDAVFSDAIKRESSPPSSPPGFPWELEKATGRREVKEEDVPSSPIRKNAFSILGKRKALGTVSDNVRPVKREKTRPSSSSKQLTQMQMSLGQKVQQKCKQCGMEYVASSSEDRKLHDKFHKQNTEGYDVGKTFVANTIDPKDRLFKGVKEGDAIVMLDCYDSYHRRKRGQAVLEIVQRELGAVAIPEEDVWDSKRQKDFQVVEGSDETRYKAFLYLRGTKCVGFVLAEKIQEAFRIERPKDLLSKKEPDKPQSTKKQTALEALQARKAAAEAAKAALAQSIIEADGQPIHLTTTKYSAVLGISRIWTSPTHRGEGIARKLLDTAVGQHNLRQAALRSEKAQNESNALPNGHARIKKIERKEQVAFSQPTDAGARLARRWFGKPYGWSVYVD